MFRFACIMKNRMKFPFSQNGKNQPKKNEESHEFWNIKKWRRLYTCIGYLLKKPALDRFEARWENASPDDLSKFTDVP